MIELVSLVTIIALIILYIKKPAKIQLRYVSPEIKRVKSVVHTDVGDIEATHIRKFRLDGEMVYFEIDCYVPFDCTLKSCTLYFGDGGVNVDLPITNAGDKTKKGDTLTVIHRVEWCKIVSNPCEDVLHAESKPG